MTTCSHSRCQCEAPAGKRYCSDYCREASQHSDAAEAFDMTICNCGHLPCLRESTGHNAPGAAAPGSPAIDSTPGETSGAPV